MRQFNQSGLEEIGAIPPGFFPPLPEQAPFEEAGVAAAQLADYLAEDEEAEGQKAGKHGAFGHHNTIHVGLGSVKELKELRDLGQLIRDNLPEWLRGGVPESRKGESPAEPGAASLSEIESRLAEAGARLQAVAEQLRRGDLSDQQRAELAEQLSRLGSEQARLARQHAELRERAAAG